MSEILERYKRIAELYQLAVQIKIEFDRTHLIILEAMDQAIRDLSEDAARYALEKEKSSE